MNETKEFTERMSHAAKMLYRCATTPCEECRDVIPRRAYPAPPHGDLRRSVDVLLVGFNPQLADYRIRCTGCREIGLVKDFMNGKDAPLRCRGCSAEFTIDDAEFVRPSLDEWTAEGLNLDAKGRSWIDRRFALDALAPSTNIVNTRLCSWPSYDAQTVSLGSGAGQHLRDLIAEVRPRVVVAYNQTSAEAVRPAGRASAPEHAMEFFTSGSVGGRPRRHVVRWIEPQEDRYGVIVSSQARDAPSATNADGHTMRRWVAIKAQSWVTAAASCTG